MILYCKKVIAFLSNILGITRVSFNKLNKKYHNNYVRVINYHNTEKEYIELFEKHIKYLSSTFNIISFDDFKRFLKGEIIFNDKPGMLITFDDGYVSNYKYGIDVLDKYRIKGTFFISSDTIYNNDKYINKEELKDLIKRGHDVGCHTKSHHRFSKDDDLTTLNQEIIDSNSVLNSELGINNDCFCFVGGEIPVYTKEAFDLICKNYSYSFTTLTQIATAKTNPLMIHRTNIESFWNLGLVKFQLSGLWDKIYKKKALEVENKLLK